MTLRFSGQNPPDDEPRAEPSCPTGTGLLLPPPPPPRGWPQAAQCCPLQASRKSLFLLSTPPFCFKHGHASPAFWGAHGYEVAAMPIAAWAEARQLAGSAPGSCLHKSPP